MQNEIRQPSDKPRYKCDICQKAFLRPSALKTHIYIHTGERPFECTFPQCGRRFTVSSNLRRHFKVHQRTNTHVQRMPANKRQLYIQKLMDRTAEMQRTNDDYHQLMDGSSIQCCCFIDEKRELHHGGNSDMVNSKISQ